MGSSTSGIDETTSLLYDACVGFMVSEKTGRDSWEKVAVFVDGKMKAGVSARDIRREFTVVEKQLKADFKVTSLPAAFRSAKATALAAAAQSVPYMMSDGRARPKTDVSKDLAASKKGAPKDYAQRAHDHLATALGLLMAVPSVDRSMWDRLAIAVKEIHTATARIPIA